jgi:DNA-binding response OmpR family regulator
MLTAFPVSDDDWQGMGADKMLVKPMHTRILLEQIEKLLASHEQKLSIWSQPAPNAKAALPAATQKAAARKGPVKRVIGKSVKSKTAKPTARKASAKRAVKASKR